MEENSNIKKSNPLQNYFRQPKIYVRLPSKGEFYGNNALDKSVNDEYAVYAMTAKDELMFKTPDALLNGQSTVEVIKSCFPAIQDPWQMPSLDVDAVLISIRIATYGEKMDVSANCPHCQEENTYEIDLNQWLASLNNFQYNKEIKVEPLTIYVRPFNYKEMTQTSLKTLEHQRIFDVINDEKLSDEEKVDAFGKSFVKLTALTVDTIASCIYKIETPEGSTSDKIQIKEFIDNAPREVFDQVQKHISDIKSKIDIKPMNVHCSSCEKEYIMPISMDQSNFFAVRS